MLVFIVFYDTLVWNTFSQQVLPTEEKYSIETENHQSIRDKFDEILDDRFIRISQYTDQFVVMRPDSAEYTDRFVFWATNSRVQ